MKLHRRYTAVTARSIAAAKAAAAAERQALFESSGLLIGDDGLIRRAVEAGRERGADAETNCDAGAAACDVHPAA